MYVVLLLSEFVGAVHLIARHLLLYARCSFSLALKPDTDHTSHIRIPHPKSLVFSTPSTQTFAMDSAEHSNPSKDDPLIQLRRKILNYQPLHPFYTYTPWLFVGIGTAASMIRYHNGWSYEEAGIWVNLGFWGGYLLSIIIQVPIIVRNCIISRSLRKDLQEFKQERARRGPEPRLTPHSMQWIEKEKSEGLEPLPTLQSMERIEKERARQRLEPPPVSQCLQAFQTHTPPPPSYSPTAPVLCTSLLSTEPTTPQLAPPTSPKSYTTSPDHPAL